MYSSSWLLHRRCCSAPKMRLHKLAFCSLRASMVSSFLFHSAASSFCLSRASACTCSRDCFFDARSAFTSASCPVSSSFSLLKRSSCPFEGILPSSLMRLACSWSIDFSATCWFFLRRPSASRAARCHKSTLRRRSASMFSMTWDFRSSAALAELRRRFVISWMCCSCGHSSCSCRWPPPKSACVVPSGCTARLRIQNSGSSTYVGSFTSRYTSTG
mmetsp:Transcript_8487/g.20454  ORF Transcript_8487/g.20454 Transcript_8487/m.20454 type:complete len:216 (+) Transcript_8487:1294-1941(+)